MMLKVAIAAGAVLTVAVWIFYLWFRCQRQQAEETR